MGWGLLILGLLLFVGLVVVHEWGHFIAARRSGVDVEEFGIGFPPRVWHRKMPSGFDFSINLLPLGGFVRLKGEHDADKAKGSFGAASLKNKVKIMLAGVAMNLVVAVLLFSGVALLGMPKLITEETLGEDQFTVASDTKITKQQVYAGFVEEDSPAAKAGLQDRDILLGIGSSEQALQNISSRELLPNLTSQYAGQEVVVRYERAGEQKLANITLRSEQEVANSEEIIEGEVVRTKGYLGISPTEYVVQRSTWSAPVVGAGVTVQITKLTFKGLGNALANLFRGEGGKASEQVAGPVGIFVLLREGTLLGYQFILMIIAIISLTLAIMNALPIPALDGGRLFVTLLFRGLKKPLLPHIEERIHGTGFALLIGLFVVITIVDVRRFF